MSTGKQHSGLQRYAAFLAICTLLLILIGAAITSFQPPVPNISVSSAMAAERVSLEQWHRILAYAVTVLALGLVAWLYAARKGGAARWLGWTALAFVILEVGLGEGAVAQKLPDALAFSHALLAQILFATVTAVAICTGPGWDREPELVEDRFSIRTMALIAPILVAAQVALGAAYRHKEMGVLTHIFGAFVVAVFILLVGCLAVKQYPQHGAIRPAAVTLMSIAGAQVLLGFAAFLLRLLTDQVTPAVVIITVAHVVTGALTFAASVFLAIQIRRNVRAVSAACVEPSVKAASS